MNIKELAEQAGYNSNADWYREFDKFDLERFAELVAEQTHTNNKAQWYQEGYEAGQRDERELCAQVCENVVSNEGYVQAKYCAAAIRARGDKHD